MAALLLCASMVLGASQKDDAPHTIEIHAKKFEYRPAEITLRKGETYRLHLTSDDVLHSLRIRELGLNGAMKPNEFTDVLFTPTQTGDFRADCGVYCGAGHKTMVLTIHVVEK
jgi:cytochrome c oxidase subunit 2